MKLHQIVVPGALLILAIPSCARHKSLYDEMSDPVVVPQEVVLEVENHNWADVVIYIVQEGRRDRLANVTAAKNTSMIIPPKFLGQSGSLQLIARRIGGNDGYITQAVSIRTGGTIVLTLESDLKRSSVAVW